jgi:hypothetical protein
VVEGTSLAIPRPGDAIAVVVVHIHAHASRSEPDYNLSFFFLARKVGTCKRWAGHRRIAATATYPSKSGIEASPSRGEGVCYWSTGRHSRGTVPR